MIVEGIYSFSEVRVLVVGFEIEIFIYMSLLYNEYDEDKSN